METLMCYLLACSDVKKHDIPAPQHLRKSLGFALYFQCAVVKIQFTGSNMEIHVFVLQTFLELFL